MESDEVDEVFGRGAYLLGGPGKITPLSGCMVESVGGPKGLAFIESEEMLKGFARSQHNTAHHHARLLSSGVSFGVLQVQAPTWWDVKVCDSDLVASWSAK